MLDYRTLLASTILTITLFVGGMEFETPNTGYAQFFENSETNDTNSSNSTTASSNSTTTSSNSTTNTTASENANNAEIVLLSQKLKKMSSLGTRELIGEVKNIGKGATDSVAVLLRIYDKNGGLIGTESTSAASSNLEPGQKTTFKFLGYPDLFEGMDHYELGLSWDNAGGTGGSGSNDNAQLYQSTSNPTESDMNGAQEKKIPTENPTTVPKSKKSYQLIIYLDNASTQNAIGDNFKILVYNSNNEPVLSAKPNIDFNDDHQKISPPKGYPIIYRSGQYPKDINVCAQQEYQLNGTTKLHDDCYPIKQNVQKTYWYTIFDYGEIDGFEGDSNLVAKSNEMTPAMDTISPENKSESNNQNAGNITGTEQVTLKAQLKPTGLLKGWYDIKKFSLAVSDGSQICPSNNCEYSVENGKIFSLGDNDNYRADGKLKVTIPEDSSSKSTLYPLGVTLDKTAEEETNGDAIEKFAGTFEVGPHITYHVTNATLEVDKNSPVLTIQGERSTSNSTSSD